MPKASTCAQPLAPRSHVDGCSVFPEQRLELHQPASKSQWVSGGEIKQFVASTVSGKKVTVELRQYRNENTLVKSSKNPCSQPRPSPGRMMEAVHAHPQPAGPTAKHLSPLEATAGLRDTTSGLWTSCLWALRSQYLRIPPVCWIFEGDLSLGGVV